METPSLTHKHTYYSEKKTDMQALLPATIAWNFTELAARKTEKHHKIQIWLHSLAPVII